MTDLGEPRTLSPCCSFGDQARRRKIIGSVEKFSNSPADTVDSIRFRTHQPRKKMRFNSACSLNAMLLVLTAVAAPSASVRADEALFKSRCAECHSRALSLARSLPGESPEEKSSLLAKFLETHHAPSPEERTSLVSYLVGLANR